MMDILDHAIFSRCLELVSHANDAIGVPKLPTSLNNPRSVLGLCNVFRRLVPKFWANRVFADPTIETNPTIHICTASKQKASGHGYAIKRSDFNPLCWLFNMAICFTIQTYATYRSATPRSKSSQKTQHNPLSTGHVCSPTPSQDTTQQN